MFSKNSDVQENVWGKVWAAYQRPLLYMEQLNNINQVARLPDPDHPLSSSEWNKSFDLMIMYAARGDHGNQAVYQLKMKMFGP